LFIRFLIAAAAQPGETNMFKNTDTKSESSTGHDGFVWSQRATVISGFILALALAVAKYAPILAAPLEWGQ
jgi:hypothetical protein